MKNYVASITTRLRNHAKAHQLEFAPLVEQFALGRLLARLSRSPYADDFILKGAQLFRIWTSHLHRPTRDADFLSFGSSDASDLERTDPNKVIQWNAFLRKSKLPAQELEEVIQRLHTFLYPVLFPPVTLPTSCSATSDWS